MKTTYTPIQTPESLEYVAILSGLSMAGNDISDADIEIARNVHTKDKSDKFSFVSVLTMPKRSA